MRAARIYMHSEPVGTLEELDPGKLYRFSYLAAYKGEPISLTMPVRESPYEFDRFPPFFDGLLPEGVMLEGLLRQMKIDRKDMFSQLLAVGHEMVGAVTAEEIS
jgi:serine/threonine-protein kinase HipA